jgi:hypothetical protein
MKALIPTLEDFTKYFECSTCSKALVTINHNTLTLPSETKRTKPLLFSYTRKIETPSSQMNSKEFDSTKKHLEVTTSINPKPTRPEKRRRILTRA